MHSHHRLDWEPTARHWRVAVFFMVGSACFALGSLPGYAANVESAVLGVTFFVGSIWFTLAALGQWYETVDHAASAAGGRRVFVMVRDLDWWAGVVQFVGTVMFNISTGAAMIDSLDTEQIDRLVWAPDMVGSVAFLAASALAWRAVCGRAWRVRVDDGEWWVAALNLAGAVAFMASAIASLVLPTTGEEVNTVIVNTGTFLGAVCFFVGAYLLLPVSPVMKGRHA